MRSTACVIAIALLAGCAGKYQPERAVLTGWDRTRAFGEDAPSTVQYSGHALVATPVIPVLPFGTAFDMAVIVGTKKTGIDHFTFGRMAGPDGVRWVAVEVAEKDGEITIISNVENLDAWAPEIPARRKVDPGMKVVDRSTEDEIEVTISYTNADNEQVEATLLGDPPHRFQKKRNADPLGALRQSGMYLIDVPHRESLFKANIKINGRGATIAKVAGFVPAQMSTEHISGGLATGAFTTISGEPRSLDSTWSAPKIIAPAGEEPERMPEPEPVAEVDPLRTQMEAGLEELQGCYTTAAEANAELEGRILLSWKVAEGAASDVSVVLDTVGDEGLATCVTGKVGGWTYGEGIDGDVGFPLTVVKGEGIQLAEGEGEGEEGGAEEGGDTEEAAPEEEYDGADGKTFSGGKRGEAGDMDEEGPDDEADGDGSDEEDLPEGSDEDELPDGDDLLGDDPEQVRSAQGARQPKVVYNGIADFVSSHVMRSGNTVELEWHVERANDRVYARQIAPERTLQYEYLVNYDSLELSDVSLFQVGRPVPVVHMDINPAIPDLRRPFSGRAESRYVIDINGQGGYATGKVEAWWSEGGPKVKFIPDAPDWTTDGSLVTTIVYRQGGSDVSVQKTGEK